jgi:hypothetical protein
MDVDAGTDGGVLQCMRQQAVTLGYHVTPDTVYFALTTVRGSRVAVLTATHMVSLAEATATRPASLRQDMLVLSEIIDQPGSIRVVVRAESSIGDATEPASAEVRADGNALTNRCWSILSN